MTTTHDLTDPDVRAQLYAEIGAHMLRMVGLSEYLGHASPAGTVEHYYHGPDTPVTDLVRWLARNDQSARLRLVDLVTRLEIPREIGRSLDAHLEGLLQPTGDAA